MSYDKTIKTTQRFLLSNFPGYQSHIFIAKGENVIPLHQKLAQKMKKAIKTDRNTKRSNS